MDNNTHLPLIDHPPIDFSLVPVWPKVATCPIIKDFPLIDADKLSTGTEGFKNCANIDLPLFDFKDVRPMTEAERRMADRVFNKMAKRIRDDQQERR